MKTIVKQIIAMQLLGLIFMNPVHGAEGRLKSIITGIRHAVVPYDAVDIVRKGKNPLAKVDFNNPASVTNAQEKLLAIIDDLTDSSEDLLKELEEAKKLGNETSAIEADLARHEAALKRSNEWLRRSEERLKEADARLHGIAQSTPTESAVSKPGKGAKGASKGKTSDEEFARICKVVKAPDAIDEISELQAIEMLKAMRREAGATAVVAPGGAGKSYNVEALAYFIQKSDHPIFVAEREKGTLVYEVVLEEMIKGLGVSKTEADIAELLIDIMLHREGLFNFDELQELMEMYPGIYALLKPVMAKSDVVGGWSGNITPPFYEKLFTDPQYIRRWTAIFINPPNKNQLTKIGQSVIKKYEKMYGVKGPSPKQFKAMLEMSEKHKKLSNPHVLITMINDLFIETASDLNDGRHAVNIIKNQKLQIEGDIEIIEGMQRNGDPESFGPHFEAELKSLRAQRDSRQAMLDNYWESFNATADIRKQRAEKVKRRQEVYKALNDQTDPNVQNGGGVDPELELENLNREIEELSEQIKQKDPLLVHGSPTSEHVLRSARKSGIPEDEIQTVISRASEDDMIKAVLKDVPGVDEDVVRHLIRRVITIKRDLEKTKGEMPFLMVVGKSNPQAEALMKAISNVIYKSDVNFFEIPGIALGDEHKFAKYWGSEKGIVGSTEPSPVDKALIDSNDYLSLAITNIERAHPSVQSELLSVLKLKQKYRTDITYAHDMDNVTMWATSDTFNGLEGKDLEKFLSIEDVDQRNEFLRAKYIAKNEEDGVVVDKNLTDRMEFILLDEFTTDLGSIKSSVDNFISDEINSLTRVANKGSFSVEMDKKVIDFLARKVMKDTSGRDAKDIARRYVINALAEGLSQKEIIAGDVVELSTEGQGRARSIVYSVKPWEDGKREVAVRALNDEDALEAGDDLSEMAEEGTNFN